MTPAEKPIMAQKALTTAMEDYLEAIFDLCPITFILHPS